MNAIQLDKKLRQDSYLIGESTQNYLLLMKNSLYPWFVLVPFTKEVEFYRLDQAHQLQLLTQINLLSKFIEATFSVDKLNIATIGNVVSQLHIHVVGRHRQDACWPGVVWGDSQFEAYNKEQLLRAITAMDSSFTEYFGVKPQTLITSFEL